MAQDDKELQLILANQARRRLAQDLFIQVLNEMKSSLVLQSSWEQLSQATPTAIGSMSACFIASASPSAAIRLAPPRDKEFLYLRYPSVQANLFECGNMGRVALLEVEDRMRAIQMTSQVINKKIGEIVPTIADPQSARRMLQPQFDAISRGAQTCLDASIAMDKKFTDWLLYVCEMHAACVQQEGTAQERLLSQEICLAAESTRLENQKSVMDDAKHVHMLLSNQVTATFDAFKKASDEFPTGWDIIGEQIVGDLAGTVSSTLNAAISSMLYDHSAKAELSTSPGLVGGFLRSDHRDDNISNLGSNSGRAGVSASQPLSPLPKSATDPGYIEIQRISAFLAILHVIVAGREEGGINWEMAKADETCMGGTTSVIKFVVTMLSAAKQRFTPLATSEGPSQILLGIFNVSLQVAKDLQAIVDKSSNVAANYPAKDSPEVEKWQTDFAGVYARANTLLATTQTMPGTAANGMPFMRNSTNSANQTTEISANSSQGQAVLEMSRNRLFTTTEMLTTIQQNYGRTTDMFSQQQDSLASIQSALTRLTASSLSLTEIKRILVESIKLVIELKTQITSLVRFFKAMCAIVETCVKSLVEPFLEALNTDSDGPNGKCRVGNYTLADLQRSHLYSTALTLRSYFSVPGDLAKIWMTLSPETVHPGLRLCDEISMVAKERDPGASASRLAVLWRWSEEASRRIKTIASEKQREIMDGMQSRINAVAQTTRVVSAPSNATVQAITAGMEVTKQAAHDSIVQRFTNSALSRFARSED